MHFVVVKDLHFDFAGKNWRKSRKTLQIHRGLVLNLVLKVADCEMDCFADRWTGLSAFDREIPLPKGNHSDGESGSSWSGGAKQKEECWSADYD